MYDPYVRECFLIAIPEPSSKNIQPCIVSGVSYFSQTCSLRFNEVWVLFEHLGRPLSLAVSWSLSMNYIMPH